MKRIIPVILIALVIAALFAGGRYFYDQWKDRQKQVALDQVVEKILVASDFEKSESSVPALADDVREYILEHTIYNETGEFLTLWPDQKKIAQAFLDKVEGRRTEPVPSECSTRSNLMSDMLRLKGHKTRNIVLYAPKKNLSSHRIIEVWNPDTQSWEAQDPLYDVYWARKNKNKRAGIAEVLASPDDHHPCNKKSCGWDLISREDQKAAWLRDYLHVATIHDKETDLRISMYASGYDPESVYTNKRNDLGTGTFCDLHAKNCRQGFIPASSFKENP